VTALQLHSTLLERQERGLAAANSYLETHTFLVGERLTLADLYLATSTFIASAVTLDVTQRAKYYNVVRHCETVLNQPKIQQFWPPIEYLEKALQFVPPAKEKKEAKPAPATAPKAEKKPKKKEVDDEDDEPLVPEEPKAKNPLDDLPKSTFNLEDWKRAYSNKETRGPGGALQWFYEKYDYATWAILSSREPLLTTLCIASTPPASPSGASTSSTTTSSRRCSCPPTKLVASSTA
jgi:elongation factor 1-gamma